MKIRFSLLALTLALSVILAGCAKQGPTPVTAEAVPQGGLTGSEGGLRGIDEASALALGTLRLEGTENAVTPAQASELLPLWKAIQAGSLQGQAETDAVLKQIEAKMADSQRAAVDGMELTFQDIGTWMQEQGIEMPTRQAGQDGPGSVGDPGQAGPGTFQNRTEEERTRLREEFQNMTQEQRATRMAEMGAQRPEGGGQRGAPGATGSFGGRAGGNFLLDPLIELLIKRAAE